MLKQNNKSAHNKTVKRSSPSDKKNTDANNSKAPEIKNIQLKILKLRKKNDEKNVPDPAANAGVTHRAERSSPISTPVIFSRVLFEFLIINITSF